MTSQWVKDPNAVLDYKNDWADGGDNDGADDDPGWLQGDIISASSWTVPSGVTEDSNSFTGTVATIWVSGGTAGEVYRLVNRIVTAGGRTEDRTITLICRER